MGKKQIQKQIMTLKGMYHYQLNFVLEFLVNNRSIKLVCEFMTALTIKETQLKYKDQYAWMGKWTKIKLYNTTSSDTSLRYMEFFNMKLTVNFESESYSFL